MVSALFAGIVSEVSGELLKASIPIVVSFSFSVSEVRRAL